MSQSNCPNCGHLITCGCQRRTASDGTSVCSNCIGAYEQKLSELKNTTSTQDATYIWVNDTLLQKRSQ